jgi:dedicator of cytokinesis protein 1
VYLSVGDVRNDIYLTLRSGDFNRGNKTADKNVEVTICVCDHKGDTMKDVISYGCGGDTSSEPKPMVYKSMVYYHEDKPKWFETLKVVYLPWFPILLLGYCDETFHLYDFLFRLWK